MPGTVVFINGASSSGKSTILRALQDMLDQPYLDMGLDRFIFMLPRRCLNRPLWDDVLGRADRAGSLGHSLVRAMHRAVHAAAMSGLNVLADHVLVESAWLDDAAHLFADLPAYLVGVQCPLEVLEERERTRKNRTLGQARLQFPLVHRQAMYDLELDSSALTAAECAQRIMDRLLSPPLAFKRLNPR